MLKIAKERLNELYAKISETMGLFIPVNYAGEVNYKVWKEGAEVSLAASSCCSYTSRTFSRAIL